MESFKRYFNIEKEITLESKVETNSLFGLYNQWVGYNSSEKRSQKKKNYRSVTIQSRYNEGLLELGLSTRKDKKYSVEYYHNNRKRYCKLSKKNTTQKRKHKKLHDIKIIMKIFLNDLTRKGGVRKSKKWYKIKK